MARLPKVGDDKGTWGGILNDYLEQSHNDDGTLKNDTVGAGQLKPSAVMTPAIGDGQVTTSKLADAAAGTAQIADQAITEAKLAGAVRDKLNAELADSAVTTSKIADGAVSKAKVQGVGEADGFATLDAGGNLPESQVPARLSDAELSANFVASGSPLAVAQVDALTRRAAVADFAHYGDSMTDRAWSGDWVSILAELTGLDHYEGGGPGETTSEISARVLADTARMDRRFTLEMGRNDVKVSTPSVAEYLAMVQASFGAFTTRRMGMVFQVPPWSDERTTATGGALVARTRRLEMDAALLKAFPLHYEPIYDWMCTTAAATAAGITFTADDLAYDIPQQVIPRSFRRPYAGGASIDGGHLNALGGAAFYYRVAQRLYERGLTDKKPIAVTINHADTFNRANGPLGTLEIGGASWVSSGGTWDILSNAARIQGAAATTCIAYVTQAGQDRYVAAKPTLYDAGLYIRGNGTTGYVFHGDASGYYIKKWDGGGSFTTIATSTGVTPSGSPFMAVHTKGPVIKAYVDGQLVCTAPDATYSGSQWGLFKYGTGTRQFDEFILRSIAD